jgi:hypothetical protein
MGERDIDSEIIVTAPPREVRSELTGSRYPIELFQQAYRMFMLEDKNVDEIAAATNLPRLVILDFSMKNQWADRKAKLLQEQVKMLEIEAKLRQAVRKSDVIERQLDNAKKIANKAAREAEEANSVRDLKGAAEAFKAASDVEARAVGIADKTVERSGGEGDQAPKAPSFFIGVGVSKVTIASGESMTIDQGPKDVTKDVEIKEETK